jgi:hypothetical protein
MIDLRLTLKLAKEAMEKVGIAHALIGGFALGAHGIHRATKDIDFLVDAGKKTELKNALKSLGFNVMFESENIIQFQGPGYLDIVLAQRPLSLEMLKNAQTSSLDGIPVVSPEGIIGLKIQAYTNDPARKYQDYADIQSLLRLPNLDFNLIKKYADLFNEWDAIRKLIDESK